LIRNGATNLLRCIQCGTCTSGCTVYEVDRSYNPRRIIQMVLVGSAELDLSKVWLCSTCGICKELCPKEVTPLEVMLAARGILLRSGLAPRERLRLLDSVFETGFAYRANEEVKRKRTTLGLPELALSEAQLEELRGLITDMAKGAGG
jgi:heterodisulfide reductase subunit C